MNLKIVNKNTELSLPGWSMSMSSYAPRLGVRNKFAQDGVYITGDKKIGRRTIALVRDITGETDTQYQTQLDDLLKIFYGDLAPFYLVDIDRGTRALVELESIAENYQRGREKRIAQIPINLIAVDGYLEDTILTIDLLPGVLNGDLNIINNPNPVDLYPLIEVKALVDNFEFSLTNNTTQDSIAIGTNLFLTDTTIEIDCVNGTVFLKDGVSQTEISHAIADATSFIFFDFGDNVILYESIYGAVDITFEYRPRHIF